MTEYWFARRFPVGNPRSAMAPVSREGRLVALGFVGAMLVGAVIFTVLAFTGSVALLIVGAVIFALLAMGGGAFFIVLSVRKGDRTHTVADYRQGRARPSADQGMQNRHDA